MQGERLRAAVDNSPCGYNNRAIDLPVSIGTALTTCLIKDILHITR
jgi:hypothetical protein